jgi:glutamine amidotransferase
VKVSILDYGAGNVASVRKAFRHVGADPVVTSAGKGLSSARAIVIPGVGHFSKTASISDEARVAVARAADAGVPILGICLGLHWLFEGSDEAPLVPGLSALVGRCRPLIAAGDIKVPHVGWNSLERTRRPSVLLEGLGNGTFAYFCHSYAAPSTDRATAASRHGRMFGAVVEHDNVFGVQFHPEKSGEAGLTILRNFLRYCAGRR